MLRMLLLLGCVGGCLAAQSLSITSAFDGSAAPFIRSEMITLALTGAEPFRPVTLFMGGAMAGVSTPGITGALAIIPASIQPFGPFDGIGIFGGGYPLMTDASGGVSFTLLIPGNFGATLPSTFRIQALVLRNPFIAPGGEAFAFSTPADVLVDEPATTPQLTQFSVHYWSEGTTAQILMEGTGLLPDATVLPTVTFTSVASGASAPAVTVTMVDVNPGTAITPALLVTAPPFIGAATLPPNSSAGGVVVTVSYANSGLYPNNPLNAASTTAAQPYAQPLSLILQSNIQPQFNSAAPRAAITGQPCTFTINGANFLSGAEVMIGGTPLPATVFGGGNIILVFAPALPQGVHDIVIRNRDHVAPSPRQSTVAAPATDYVVFAPVLGAIQVTSVTPASVTEGAPAAVTISGTCPVEGAHTALESTLGVLQLNVGSNILGTDAVLPVAVNSVTIPAPGQFAINATLPAFPPGLNPIGPTAAGLSNCGTKHFQITPTLCLNPGLNPHKTFAAITSGEPGNAFLYRATNPPAVTFIGPNNCARFEGGQLVTITGTNFFTTATVFAPYQPGLMPTLALQSGATLLPLTNPFMMLGGTAMAGTLPDASSLGGPWPMQVNLVVTNPDGQVTSGSGDDFWLYPSLASTTANTFPIVTGTVNTGTLATPIVYTFTGDLDIPAGVTITATGSAPLLIRCRGNANISGVINLDGDSLPGQLSAGAVAGGAAATALTLAAQDPFQGNGGLSAFDPMTAFFYSGGGLGGWHATPDAGGGGGGGMGTNGAAGLAGSLFGGAGGLSYGFPALPIPVLGSATLMENFWPPAGSGGGAGGLGTPTPFNPLNPPPLAEIGFNGAGGRGAGSLAIMADSNINIIGSINVRGEVGSVGAVGTNGSGGGGGGGSGGAVLLQSIRGIAFGNAATANGSGGAGGLGGTGGVNDGGTGSSGLFRWALPANSAFPALSLIISPTATITPAAGTVGY